MAKEMGKPLTQGIAETEASKSYVTFQPLGLILAVMPWNFPLWQVFRFAAPALLAGNGSLLKHASHVTGSALEIEKILRAAGCPENLFRTLRIQSSDVSAILKYPLIKAIFPHSIRPAITLWGH